MILNAVDFFKLQLNLSSCPVCQKLLLINNTFNRRLYCICCDNCDFAFITAYGYDENYHPSSITINSNVYRSGSKPFTAFINSYLNGKSPNEELQKFLLLI